MLNGTTEPGPETKTSKTRGVGLLLEWFIVTCHFLCVAIYPLPYLNEEDDYFIIGLHDASLL